MPELFEDQQTKPNTVDPSAVKLEDLVGEDKKFKTVEDLARAKIESDNFIETLLIEKKGVEKELEKYASTDEKLDTLLDQLKNAQEPQSTSSNVEPTNSAENGDQQKVDMSEIEKLLEQKLQSRTQEDRARSNLQKVNEIARDAWGDAANAKVQEKAKQLGMSTEQLKSLAQENPNVFLAAVGLTGSNEVTQIKTSAPQGSVDTTKQNPTSAPTGVKNFKYYEAIRKENPDQYRKLQLEMHEQAIAQGEKFYE